MRAAITRWITDDDSPAARRLRSRVGGLLFVLGTVIDVTSIGGQRGWSAVTDPFVVVTTLIAITGGVVLMLRPIAVSAIAGYVVLTAAVAMTGVVQVVIDPATTAGQAAGVVYIWLTVCAALYCTTAATIVQAVWVAVVYGAALAAAGTSLWLPQWAMTVGTCVVITTVVSRLSAALRRRADVDALTEATTRRALMVRLGEEIDVAARHGGSLAVVMLDLDKFKELNDTHGHAAGDRALVECARRWRRDLRPGDTLARLGGDEFLVVLPRCAVDEAERIAARLVAETTGVAADLGASAGVTPYLTGDNADALLHRSDRALYQAKASGGGAVYRV